MGTSFQGAVSNALPLPPYPAVQRDYRPIFALMASSVRRSRLRRWSSVEARTRGYTASLVALAAGLVVVLWRSGVVIQGKWSIAGLATVALVVERGRVRLGDRHEESISLLPTLFAAMLGGPAAGMVVGAASFLGDLRKPYSRWAVYTCTRSLSGAGAGFVAFRLGVSGDKSVFDVLIATTSAALTIEVLDLVFVTLTGLVRNAFSHPGEVARARGPLALAAIPLSVPMVAMLVVAHREISPWTLPLFFGPALAAQRLFVMYQAKSALAESLSAANSKLEGASLAFATSLVAALDARDKYTAGHSASVAMLAERIAGTLGLGVEQRALAYRCGLVHDIGKISLPVGLLEKQGPLTTNDLSLLQQHPRIGAEILERSELFSEMADIVRSHHERIDGTGYPNGLKGHEIPLLSRVIAVADAYDAMTADRPYREALSWGTAMERLSAGAGQQFDAAVVSAFTSLATSERFCRKWENLENAVLHETVHPVTVSGHEREGEGLRSPSIRAAVTV